MNSNDDQFWSFRKKKIVIIQALNMLFAELKDCQLEEI